MLAAIAVPAADIEEELREMSEVVFGRTHNRSVLGTMNEYAFMAKAMRAQGRGPDTLEGLMRFPGLLGQLSSRATASRAPRADS